MGGVTVGISGWSCGAGALQPLAYSRPHSTTAKKLPFYRLTVNQKLHNADQLHTTIAIPHQNPIILFCLATKLRSGERQREDHTEDVRERI